MTFEQMYWETYQDSVKVRKLAWAVKHPKEATELLYRKEGIHVKQERDNRGNRPCEGLVQGESTTRCIG